MRRFELVDGKSSKFWEVDVRGGELHLQWGKLGTAGQSKVKDLGTTDKARTECEKQIASKLKKGYSEVTAGGDGSAGGSSAPPSLESSTAPPAPKPTEPAHTSPVEKPWPDETQLRFPEAWVRYILPRRNGQRPPIFNPLSGDKALEVCREKLQHKANLTEEQWRLAKIGLEDPSIPPRKAAHTGFALAIVRDGAKARRAWIDWLVAERGAAYATAALLKTDALVNRADSPEWHWDGHLYYQLRTHLAVIEETAYEEAKVAAQEYLTDPGIRVRAAFLFPETDWAAGVSETDYHIQHWLLATYSEPEQLRKVLKNGGIQAFRRGPISLFPTFIDALGLQAGPLLVGLAERAWTDAETAKKLSEALACFPQEETFDELLALAAEHKAATPALRQAIQSFPCLALRVFSKRRREDLWVRQLLELFPGVLERVEGQLDPEQLKWLNDLVRNSARPEPAEAAACPKFLLDPPWNHRKKQKAARVELETLPHEPSITWEPGLRESWRGREWVGPDMTLKQYYATLSGWQTMEHQVPANIATGPPTAARELLKAFELPNDLWYLNQSAPGIVARFELEALPLVRLIAGSKPADAIPLFQPFDDLELCRVAAEAYGRLKSVRTEALDYLSRYPRTAAVSLIPDAFGRAGKTRSYAEEALLGLARNGHREPLLEVARGYGVENEFKELLGRDPLDHLPKKMPALPDWLDGSVGLLPPLLLRSGEGVLPEQAVRNLLLMLSISRPEDLYPGVEMAYPSLSSESCAEFAWQLFEIWMKCGGPTKDSWAFYSLGWLGDDSIARRLTPILKKWPGEGLHARAVQGLEVLASLGSEVALMHLYGLSQKLKFKGLKNKAGEKVQEIAENRGLTTEELGDRLVPDFGLDEVGALTLDYGSRSFTLGFDEQLKPYLLDEAGKRLKDLPKPGKKDGEYAESEYARYKALKKDVRTVAKQQLTRLEQAMCHQRRWSVEDFQRYFLDHPLVVHLVRRLIWAVFEGDKVVGSFRVAEDGTLADAEDEEWALPAEGVVGLPHRLELSGRELAAWGEVLSDYELLQPFPQLNRDVYPRQTGSDGSKERDRVKGREVDTTRVLGLESRGWRRGEAQDGGVTGWMYREFPEQRVVHLDLEPGIAMGDPLYFPKQTLQELILRKSANAWSPDSQLPFSRLTDVYYSELIRDLETLFD